MRSLRSGRALTEQDSSTTSVNEQQFREALDRTIAAGAERGLSVFVFKTQGSLIPLQQWNDMAPRPDGRIDSAIERSITAFDDTILLCRTDGHSLVGFSKEPRSQSEAEALGGRLMAAMTTQMGEPGHEFVVSPRLGVAVIDRYDLPAEDAIDAASRTLLQTNFEAPFLVHNDYIQNRSLRQDQVGDELPGALMSEQITIEFQPRLTTPEGVPVGLEAFPRWVHGDRGNIPTVEFLRVAEQTGLLVELGHYVRRAATAAAAEWRWSQWLNNCRLWLNISPVELCHQDLIGSIVGLRQEYPNVPLGLEVVDARLLEDPVFMRIFDRLGEAGIMLALDNVRASALSVGRIHRLPMNMINLDGELVRSLPARSANRALVRFLCSYARAENRMVTACGIETGEQLRVATALGVHLVQGKAVSEPLPGDQMAARLRGGADGTDRRNVSQED
jgi:EAL domain-containing protein (putative c-di-GMP-specific phosphodiesterase class I)